MLAAAVVTAASPDHLVVLQHGLYGGASNLAVLRQCLVGIGGDNVLVHLASANEGMTRDGVAAGGRRLAAEIRSVAASAPSLESLSLVGNSLGGLYVRAAAAELYGGGQQELGLAPNTLVTTGCPHLGVRRYTYLPLPPALHSLGGLVAGRTASDLLLRRTDADPHRPLLVEMADPDSRYGVALRSFQRRRLYANLRGDFMVPFGTAAIETGGWAAGVGDGRLVARFAARRDVVFRDVEVCGGRADGIGVVCEQRQERAEEGAEGAEWEEEMRAGLSAVAWDKVGVSFRAAGTLTPLAHNKLPALRREGWRRAFEWVEQAQEGVPVMEDAARFVVGGRGRGGEGRGGESSS